MDCMTISRISEGLGINGTLSDADLAATFHECVPDICPPLYGTGDFDLAGEGVLWSHMVQIVLLVLFGPLLAYSSRFISPHASPSTRLTMSRLLAVMDTIYRSGCILSVAVIITGHIRTRQGLVSGIERNMLKNFCDIATISQQLAILAWWIRKEPANVKRSQSTGVGWVFLMYQVVNLSTIFLKAKMDKMSSAPALQVAQSLCHHFAPGDFPKLSTAGSSSGSAGWNPYLVGAGLGILLVIILATAAFFLPKKLLSFLWQITQNRIVQGIFAILWVLACTFCLFVASWESLYVRQYLKEPQQWDLAQTGAIILWIPPGWHILLTLLTAITPVTTKPDQNAIAHLGSLLSVTSELMYISSFGAGPSIQKSDTHDRKCDHLPDQHNADGNSIPVSNTAETETSSLRPLDEKQGLNNDNPLPAKDEEKRLSGGDMV